jgi:hypothetical protein
MLPTDDEIQTIRGKISPMMKGDHPSTFVQFYVGAIYHASKSADAGCPKYVDTDHIIITFSGDTKTIDRPVTDIDKQRFQEQYKLWKDNNIVAMEGTPLSELRFLTPATIADLNYHKVFNAEALAEMPDTAIQAVGMGAMGWKHQAVAYLAESKAGAEKKRLATENENLKTDLAAMKQQLAELGKLLEEKTSPTGKTKAA